MLAPDITTVYNQLTDAYNSVTSLDGFSSTGLDLQLLKLPNEANWLPGVRKEFDLLREASNSWMINRPKVWAPVILAFTDYSTTFLAVAEDLKKGKKLNKEEWLSILNDVLLPAIKQGQKKLSAADSELNNLRSKFSRILPLIDESIQKGWIELGAEEQAMQDLAFELSSLSSQAMALGSKIDSDAISTDKAIVTTSAKMLYAATSAGAEASIPVLGVAIAVITISKGFYDIVKDAQELEDTMREITKIQSELSDEAQGLALTKGTLQVLYNLEKQFLMTQDSFPILMSTWTNEETKIQEAVNALNAGADPSLYFDLQSIPSAAANWQAIDGFNNKLINIDTSLGLPVTFDIANHKIIEGVTKSQSQANK